MKQFLSATITILLSILIYFNENATYLLISLFILLLTSALIENYFAYITIIPLIKINPTYFFILLVLSIIFVLITKSIKRTGFKILSLISISLPFHIITLLWLNFSLPLIISTVILQALILSANVLLKKYPSVSFELLIFIIALLNFKSTHSLALVSIYTLCALIINYLFRKNFFMYHSFILMIYLLYKSLDFNYALIAILAYLPHFLFYKYGLKNENNVELLLDDINQNISDFCSLMSDFSNDNFNTNWEKRLSNAILILIESNCKSCKNRTECYTNLKFKTYKYLKNLLLNNNELGYFTCLYYSDMALKAKDLSVKNQLLPIPKKEGYQFDNLSSSLSNYFIALFQKITPKTMMVLNFKQKLDLSKIKNYRYQIFDDYHYSIDISCKQNYQKELITLANQHFSNIQIKKSDDGIKITPKINYFISYDSATLSHNNYQLSGDNFMFKNLDEGIFICALSDGMGSGYEAYKLSSETLRMITKIISCTLDFETSLTILNNFFKIKDLEEAYSTLDFVDINLLNGKMNLYKLGSATTYIVRNEKIIPIYNNCLPFGINDLITKEEYDLKNDDLVILISDGVTDYISEAKLQKVILNLKNETPHKIVYEILQGIYRENNSKINDDMTCIAIKIAQLS